MISLTLSCRLVASLVLLLAISTGNSLAARTMQIEKQKTINADGVDKRESYSLPTGSNAPGISLPSKEAGDNVSINNQVSNVNIGNKHKTNINMISHSGPPTIMNTKFPSASSAPSSPTSQASDAISSSGIDLSKILSQAGLSKLINFDDASTTSSKNSSPAPKQRPVSAQYPRELAYLPSNSPPSYLPATGGRGHARPRARTPQESVRKPVKQKKMPTNEQVELKDRLLSLAANVTANLPETDDDAIMLKFNKDAGKFEPFKVDPQLKAQKEKLQQALDQLSPKKLSAKKLSPILMDNGDQDYVQDLQQISKAPGSNWRASQFDDAPDNEYIDDRQQRAPDQEDYDSDNYEQASSTGSSEPVDWVRPEDYHMLDYDSLIDQVRTDLVDRLDRIGDLLHFRPEFLEQLIDVDDAELTPVEGLFKRLILCYTDEQFCSEQDSESSDGYDDEYASDEDTQQAYRSAPKQADRGVTREDSGLYSTGQIGQVSQLPMDGASHSTSGRQEQHAGQQSSFGTRPNKEPSYPSALSGAGQQETKPAEPPASGNGLTH